jgi:hypothetical protein
LERKRGEEERRRWREERRNWRRIMKKWRNNIEEDIKVKEEEGEKKRSRMKGGVIANIFYFFSFISLYCQREKN